MKNFYEATVIKPTLNLNITVTLEPVGECFCLFTINKQLWWGDVLKETTSFHAQSPLDAPIEFMIKPTRQHPQAIIVKDISIDGHSIMPIYMNQANPPTNYLDFNHPWKLKISNFYPWFHEITGQGWIA